MSNMIKFGVSVPTGREGLMVPIGFASRKTIVEAAKYAEHLGYYSIWGNDHLTTQNYIKNVTLLLRAINKYGCHCCRD